jgi:drug/metabolite transporter (DMT)-like permease
MRDFLRWIEPGALWTLFFLTSVYGHVGLKLAVGPAAGSSYGHVLRLSATNLWGWSAVLAWGLSCALWTLTLSRHELMTANAISSLRYLLTCIAAYAFFGEEIGWQRAAGMLLIALGIVLVK